MPAQPASSPEIAKATKETNARVEYRRTTVVTVTPAKDLRNPTRARSPPSQTAAAAMCITTETVLSGWVPLPVACEFSASGTSPASASSAAMDVPC
jgi:hypothetical protein